MKYEWDENKRISNIKKHHLDFAEAHFVFEDKNAIKYPDERNDYGEERFIIVGEIKGVLAASVCFCERNGKIRIISMRRASKKEREAYYGNSPIFR